MRKLILILSLLNFTYAQTYTIGRVKIDDVALHVDGSILLTCGLSQMHYNLTNEKSRFESILFGAASSLVIGIAGKEFVHDKFMKRGVFSLVDIASDVWGTTVGVVIMICKFDFDEYGLITRKSSARRSKFNKKKYILD